MYSAILLCKRFKLGGLLADDAEGQRALTQASGHCFGTHHWSCNIWTGWQTYQCLETLEQNSRQVLHNRSQQFSYTLEHAWNSFQAWIHMVLEVQENGRSLQPSLFAFTANVSAVECGSSFNHLGTTTYRLEDVPHKACPSTSWFDSERQHLFHETVRCILQSFMFPTDSKDLFSTSWNLFQSYSSQYQLFSFLFSI